jgi:hypothetical protein
MRNCTAHSGPFLIVAAILIYIFSPEARAQEVLTTPSSTGSASSTSPDSPTTPAALPVEQTGTGIFAGVPIKVSVSLRTGYDDNVTTFNADKQGTGYTSGSVGLSYEFGSPRTRLSLELGLGVTYFWQHIRNVGGTDNNDYDLANHLSLSLTHKATPRLTLSMATYLSYQSEPDFTQDQGLNRRTGNFFLTHDNFSAAYQWMPRFSTRTSYSLAAVNYGDSAGGEFQDRFDNSLGNQFRYLLLPSTSLVADYRFQFVTYIHDTSRDSTTQVILGGLDHKFDPRLNASLRGGAQFRDYDQGGSRSSPYFEGSLYYTVGKQTNISWTNRYSLEESDIEARQSRTTFRTGLVATHSFTPRIKSSLSAHYAHSEYQSPSSLPGSGTDLTGDTFDLGLALRYSVTRYLGVEVGYDFTDVSSDSAFRDYSRNRYWVGLNFTF